MSYPAEPYARWCRRVTDASAVLGAVVWLALRGPVMAGAGSFVASVAESAVLLAVLVLVPLVFRLSLTESVDGTLPAVYVVGVFLQPLAGLLVPFSFLLPEGPMAGVLVLPWLGVVACLTVFGLWRLLPRGTGDTGEAAIDAGLLYVPIGGVALLLHRLGLGFLQFGALLVLLAAMHFHFAGLTLPVLSGVAARTLPEEGRIGAVVDAALWTIILGPVFILVGITFSPAVEVVSVGFFTVAVAAFSLCVLFRGLPGRPRPQQLLVGASALSIVVSMGFALAFGVSAFGQAYGLGALPGGFPSLTEMARFHGRLNALGFALLGAVGWRLAVPDAPDLRPRVRFSRLAGDGYVGTEFLDRPDVRGEGEYVGMVDDLGQLGGFDPAAVDPAVRAVFERSGEARMAVTPDWPPVLGWLAKYVYRPLAKSVGQLVLPVETETGITGDAVPIDDAADGREDVRAWARSYDDGSTMYAGVYAVQHGMVTVSFPIPLGSLTGVLRLEPGEVPGALHETSHGDGDAGLYLVVLGFPIRLPIDESFEFVPAEGVDEGPFPDSDGVTATHTVTLSPPFDAVRLFTLTYRIEFPERPQA